MATDTVYNIDNLVIYNPSADTLIAVYEQAAAVEMPQAWRNALETAYSRLLEGDGYPVEFGPLGEITLVHIESASRPGRVYVVNGECDCEAAQNGHPCWHRAAKRLLALAYTLDADGGPGDLMVAGRRLSVRWDAPMGAYAALVDGFVVGHDLTRGGALDAARQYATRPAMNEDALFRRGREAGKVAYRYGQYGHLAQYEGRDDAYSRGFVRGWQAGKAQAEMDECFGVVA